MTFKINMICTALFVLICLYSSASLNKLKRCPVETLRKLSNSHELNTADKGIIYSIFHEIAENKINNIHQSVGFEVHKRNFGPV